MKWLHGMVRASAGTVGGASARHRDPDPDIVPRQASGPGGDMTYQTLTYAVTGRVATITLDRGRIVGAKTG